ncbi:DUF4397 domain-containing protein [Chitinophaga vietnamensis]|uniref:DUF4397 domain-containing protein n=1 Tax=Chitinophaga vietnamensis TaxID=2593957 RepID=UPI0011780650|nr:DUF4397 domain-containing protein [Chitinophaga vietnamensis]
MKKSVIPVVVIAALMITFFFSCSKNDNNDVPIAGLMAFNLSPDQGAVAVTLSGNILPGNPLYYMSYSGVYLNIFAANRTVRTYDFISGAGLASTSYNFQRDKYYSHFFMGARNNYTNVVVPDVIDSLSKGAASSGKAYIRYVNAIPDSSKPLVTMVANGDSIIKSWAPYTAVSGFAAVTPGPVAIAATNAGSINVARTISVEAQKVYTVLLVGMPGASDASRTVQIRYVINGVLSQSTFRQDSAAVAQGR